MFTPGDGLHAGIGDPNQADAICDRLLHDAHRLELTGPSIQPPICTDRALELSWKDSNIRYLDHLGNSDIAENLLHT